MCLFLTVLLVGLRTAIIAFPAHTHLFYDISIVAPNQSCFFSLNTLKQIQHIVLHTCMRI